MKASIVLIIENDKILAVSRKDSLNSWGLPGGKAEDGEDEITTASREFLEETGCHVANLRKILVRNHSGYDVSLFGGELVEVCLSHKNAEGCQVDWLTPAELSLGTFSEFNKNMLEELGILHAAS
jgi:8-oxo-dGTP pyrophosphatase MutT (NUDIX family)